MKTLWKTSTMPFPKLNVQWPTRFILAVILGGILTSAGYGVARVAEFLIREHTTPFITATVILSVIVLADMKVADIVHRVKEENVDAKIRERFTRFTDDFVADIHSTPLLGSVLADPNDLAGDGRDVSEQSSINEQPYAYDSGYYAKLRAESNAPYEKAHEYFERDFTDALYGNPHASTVLYARNGDLERDIQASGPDSPDAGTAPVYPSPSHSHAEASDQNPYVSD